MERVVPMGYQAMRDGSGIQLEFWLERERIARPGGMEGAVVGGQLVDPYPVTKPFLRR